MNGAEVRVLMNGAPPAIAQPTGSIFVYGLAGNDTLRVYSAGSPFTATPAIPRSIEFDGQGGADTYEIGLGAVAGQVSVKDTGAEIGTQDTIRVYATAEADWIEKGGNTPSTGTIKWWRRTTLPAQYQTSPTNPSIPVPSSVPLETVYYSGTESWNFRQIILGGSGNDFVR